MQLRKVLVSGIAAMALLGLSGCQFGGADNPPPPADESITIKGKAVDGYLRNAFVCLDLNSDKNCNLGKEPIAQTQKDGSYELKISATHQKHENYGVAKLLVYGGEDSDTGKYFTGRLITTFDPSNLENVFITPLTTLTSAIQDEDASLTHAQAKAKVATLLDLNVSDVSSDPVAKAKSGDKSVLNQTLQLQKAVEILASAGSSASSADAAEKVIKAMAKGAVNIEANDTNNRGVGKLVENAPDSALDAKVAKVKEAAKVVARNVEKAVELLDATGSADMTKAIAATANSIENVKEALKTQVAAYNGSTTFATDVNDSAVTGTQFRVTEADVEKIIIKNTIINKLPDANITDAMLTTLVEQNASMQSDFAEITRAIEIASQEDNATFGGLANSAETVVKIEETQAAMNEAVDTTITTESVLKGEGIFDFTLSYIDSNVSEMVRYTMDDEGQSVYRYVEENKSFALYQSMKFSQIDSSKTIALENGAWATKTISMVPYYDAQGNFVIEQNGRQSVIALTAINAQGLSIENTLKANASNAAFSTSATFGAGAMIYHFDMTERYMSEGGHFIYYYSVSSPNIDGSYAVSGENDNYEWKSYTDVNYTSLEEFVAKNSDGIYREQAYVTVYMDDNSTKNGSIVFAPNNTFALLGYGYQNGQYTSFAVVEGNYTLETSDQNKTLVLNYPHRATTSIVWVEKEGVVYQGTRNFDTNATTYSSWNRVSSYKSLPFTTLDAFLASKPTLYSYVYSANGSSSTTYDCQLVEGGVINIIEREYNNSSYTSTTKPADLNGTWEIRTVDGVEMVYTTIPERYVAEYEVGTQAIYAVQEGAVRKGFRAVQTVVNAQTSTFDYFNEAAVMQIKEAFDIATGKVSATTTSSTTPTIGALRIDSQTVEAPTPVTVTRELTPEQIERQRLYEIYQKEQAYKRRIIYGF